MPSVSKVMKVSHSPCQEWGLKVISQRYDLMSPKPSDARSVPMSVRDAAVLERTLRSALESYKFQLRTMTALFHFSGDSGQIPLELWPSWRQEEENLSSVTWCLPSRRLRSAICCQILSSSRRIYLRLPLLTQLDMPQGMCPYYDRGIKVRTRVGQNSLMFELLPIHGSFSMPTITLNILAYSNTSSILTHLTTFNTIPFMTTIISSYFLFFKLLLSYVLLLYIPHIFKHAK